MSLNSRSFFKSCRYVHSFTWGSLSRDFWLRATSVDFDPRWFWRVSMCWSTCLSFATFGGRLPRSCRMRRLLWAWCSLTTLSCRMQAIWVIFLILLNRLNGQKKTFFSSLSRLPDMFSATCSRRLISSSSLNLLRLVCRIITLHIFECRWFCQAIWT